MHLPESKASLRLLRFVRLMRQNIERDIFIDPVKRFGYIGMIDAAIEEFERDTKSTSEGTPMGSD